MDTKKEKLKKLDELVLNRMISILGKDDGEAYTDELKDLTPVINYLRNNAMVADKEKSTIEKDTAKRLAEAKARRKKNESK
jgi:hypothetical protein